MGKFEVENIGSREILLALHVHMPDPGLIRGTPYGLLSLPGMMP